MAWESRLIPTHAGKTLGHHLAGHLHRAHPHSRGENAKDVAIPALQDGSSPLTRGKLDEALDEALTGGLIPTHAGKTTIIGAAKTAWAAHPHSRGENAWKLKGKAIVSGSSPLTRGKLRWPGTRLGTVRLIPTHAGKTTDRNRPARDDRAHPHSRGENSCSLMWSLPVVGSSPLTRGKRGARQRTRRLSGLIPTHAGKTTARISARPASQAHPHSRGENQLS